jgi:hypothetical protein
LIPTVADHHIIKIAWSKSSLQIGRRIALPEDLYPRNDVILTEKRISNMHCRITLGVQTVGSSQPSNWIERWRDDEGEPEVWIEDLKSSNGTFVSDFILSGQSDVHLDRSMGKKCLFADYSSTGTSSRLVIHRQLRLTMLGTYIGLLGGKGPERILTQMITSGVSMNDINCWNRAFSLDIHDCLDLS